MLTIEIASYSQDRGRFADEETLWNRGIAASHFHPATSAVLDTENGKVFLPEAKITGVPTAAHRHFYLRACILGESNLVNHTTAIYLGSRMVSSTDSAT